MSINFKAVLRQINGAPLRRIKEKSEAQLTEEKAVARSGKNQDEIRRELEIVQLKYSEFEDLTLSFVAGEALLNTLKGEENISGAERYDRRKLARRVYENDQTFTEVEKNKIKELIAKAFENNAQVVGAAYELMDQK